MNLDEALKTLDTAGYKLIKEAGDPNEMVDIEFSVNRQRDIDGGPQVIKCRISRTREYAEKIDYHSENYDEDFYERRFLKEAPRIATAISGYECGYDWYIEDDPHIVK